MSPGSLCWCIYSQRWQKYKAYFQAENTRGVTSCTLSMFSLFSTAAWLGEGRDYSRKLRNDMVSLLSSSNTVGNKRKFSLSSCNEYLPLITASVFLKSWQRLSERQLPHKTSQELSYRTKPMYLPFTRQKEELFLCSLHVLSTMPVLWKHKTCHTLTGREHSNN